MDVIAILTVAALVVGMIDGVMTLALLHRDHEIEDRLSRDELHNALAEHHDNVVDTLLRAPRFYVPSGLDAEKLPDEPGQIQPTLHDSDRSPRWWIPEPGHVEQGDLPEDDA